MIRQKDLLVIILMTFLTVVAWIGFHIYHIVVTSTISEELQIQILPIVPDFDMNSISNLRNREQLEPLYQYNKTAEENNSTKSAEIVVTPAIETVEISPAENNTPQITGEP